MEGSISWMKKGNIKNNILYAGYKKETFSKYHEDIEKSNKKVLDAILKMAIIILALLFILSCFHPLFIINRRIYLSTEIVLMVAYFVIRTRTKDKYVLWLLYAVVFVGYHFGIIMGTVNLQDGNAVTVCVLIMITPLFILDYPYRILIFNIIVFVLFSYFAIRYKVPRYADEDIMNMVMFLVCSSAIVYYAIHTKLKSIINQVQVIVQRDTDFLTKVCSREAISNYIEMAISQHKTGSLFLIDVDKFKLFNDNFGHDVGDEILIAVAEALHVCAKDKGQVGRFGGDEFVVFFPDMTQESELQMISQAMLREADQTVRKDVLELRVTLSIGVAVISEPGTEDFDSLYKKADESLYDVKERGRNGFTIWKEK